MVMASVLTAGSTKAAPTPRAGQTAPNRYAQVKRRSRSARAASAPGPQCGSTCLVGQLLLHPGTRPRPACRTHAPRALPWRGLRSFFESLLGSGICPARRTCSQELAWALDLALWTGQRQGDLLKLSWTQVRDGWLVLRQGKTKARVGIPLTGTFGAIVEGIPKRATTILTNSRGLPWTESGFRASWSKAFNETGLSDLHFNDLRGTAVVNLADAKCSIPEIASITGHKLKSVHGILERYWSPTQTQAANAVAKIEAFRGKSGT